MEHHGGGRHRIGRWLPHQEALEDWLEGLVETCAAQDVAEPSSIPPSRSFVN